jgi:hypothetical protein
LQTRFLVVLLRGIVFERLFLFACTERLSFLPIRQLSWAVFFGGAKQVGALLSSGLRELAERHLLIGDVRGCGLFIGVDLVSDRETRQAATKQASLVCSRLKVRLSQLGKPLSLLLVVFSFRLFTLLLLLLLFCLSPCCVWPLASSVRHLF